MYQKNNSRNRFQQQWAFLTRRLQRWTKSGDFARFSREKQQDLLERLRRLYRHMLRFQSAQRLRKALGTAAVLLGLAAAPNLQAQVNFAAPQSNPFGLTTEAEIRFDALADIDGDGDLDILSIFYESDGYDEEQVFGFRENIGTAAEPLFAAPTQDDVVVNLPASEESNYVNPAFVDLDGDGDLDLMVGSYNYDSGGTVTYFENTGDAQNPQFGEPVVNPFGMNFAGSSAVVPTAADLDGDGDYDVISLFYTDAYMGYEYGIVYVENTGTAMAPAFATAQRQAFNLPDDPGEILFLEFGDIDNDGDLDLLAGSTYDDDSYDYDIPFMFYENTGDAQNPNFSAGVENPFGLVSATSLFLIPMLGDLDNDGDLDVLHGSNYNEETYETFWSYQENLLLMVDVEDQALASNAFTVFPTVSSGEYQLQITGLTSSEPLSLNVFNELGQLVREVRYEFAPAASFELDISALPAGVYQVELKQADQRWVRPVIKQ